MKKTNQWVRVLAGVLLCVMVAVSFAGCSQKTNTGGKMHYDLTAEPVNLDPQTASDLSSKTVINQIFEALFNLDENGDPVCAAAESYTVSADETTYQITLRSDMLWSDGSKLLAEDYAFGLQRLLLAETQSPYASQFYGIVGAKAYHDGKADFSEVGIQADGLQLTITLSAADDHFITLLASTAAMPCNQSFFESTKGKYGLEASSINANGPFYLEKWSHGEYLKLTANANYRDAEHVMITGVTMWTNNIEGREETFWKGNTQACYVDGQSYVANATADTQSDAISNTIYGVVFNSSNELLQNTKIRKALAALFDRDSYASALPGYLTVTDRAYPSDCAVHSKPYLELAPNAPDVSASVEKAKAWFEAGLEELGVSRISGLKILTLADDEVSAGDYFLQLSQVYQRELDLYIGVERLEQEEYDAAIASGDYDLAILPIAADDLSPASILASFASGSYACSSSDFLKLYRQLSGASTEDSLALMQQAEEILLSEGWFLPMYEQQMYFVCGSDTTGITYSPYTGLVSFRDAAFVGE